MKKRQMWRVTLEGAPLSIEAENGRRILYRGGGQEPVPRAELDLDVEANDLAEASSRALSVSAGVEQPNTTAEEPWRVVMVERGREIWTKD